MIVSLAGSAGALGSATASSPTTSLAPVVSSVYAARQPLLGSGSFASAAV